MAVCKEESIMQNVKEKILTLHCPFTWNILDAITKHNIMRPNINDEDIEDSCPLEHFIICLLNCYKGVLSANNDLALANIENAQELLMEIQQQKDLHQIIRAIEHVFYATKCFYWYEIDYMKDSTAFEILEILENIDIKDFNSVEFGGLYGCESVTWSCFNDYGIEKAIDLGKKAVENNEDCALWHFILAKNLRRKRRCVNLSDEVSYVEKRHFEIAHAMSTENHVFGIYYLQMRLESYYKFCRDRNYRERKSNNERQVLEKAENMFKKNPTNYKVLLKLARIFITIDVADYRHYGIMCLDAVEKIRPNNSTCFHYYAMIYRQSGDYREAIKYFKKAAECNNFVAEISYVEYGWEVGELEPLPHLLQMLKKYNNLIEERQISLLVAIAITYYSLHNDIPNAGKYFLKALAVDPQNKKFKIYYKFLDFSTQNLSLFLEKEFCPRLLEKKCKETHEKMKDLLHPEMSKLTKEFDLSLQTVCSSINTSNAD